MKILIILASLFILSCTVPMNGGELYEFYTTNSEPYDSSQFSWWFTSTRFCKGGTVYLNIQYYKDGILYQEKFNWFYREDMKYILKSTNITEEYKKTILKKYNEAVEKNE